MKTKILLPFVFAAALAVTGARAGAADDPSAAPAATPAPADTEATTPAPAVSMPTPNQILYVPRLPSAQELANAAAAQKVGIEQMLQTSAQITVVYKYANGQTNVVAYQLLPTANVAQPTPAPKVVYRTAPPRVVYYSDPYWAPSYAYYPDYYWYPPVSLSLGFGYGWGGHFHGGYRGGFHGGHGGHHGWHH